MLQCRRAFETECFTIAENRHLFHGLILGKVSYRRCGPAKQNRGHADFGKGKGKRIAAYGNGPGFQGVYRVRLKGLRGRQPAQLEGGKWPGRAGEIIERHGGSLRAYLVPVDKHDGHGIVAGVDRRVGGNERVHARRRLHAGRARVAAEQMQRLPLPHVPFPRREKFNAVVGEGPSIDAYQAATTFGSVEYMLPHSDTPKVTPLPAPRYVFSHWAHRVMIYSLVLFSFHPPRSIYSRWLSAGP